MGIVTGNDGLYIAANKQELLAKIKKKYQTFDAKLVRHINYRPFDKRFLYNNIELLERNRHKVMQHFLKGDNVGLVFKLGNAEKRSVAAMVTKSITDFRSWSRPGMQGGDYVAPLYLYANTNGQQSTELTAERTPNLRPEIVQQIAQCLSLPFVFEKEADAESFAPIDILDYIYAVLHSPVYRQTYQEFLKIDFPRVPYPTTAAAFWQWVALGGALRQVHLLESAAVAQYATKYPIDGDNTVAKPQYTDNKVFINDTQYFDNVPIAAWEFYIGGYQPAQKWLKDRLDKNLDFEDIVHYQKMIAALLETQNLMQQIAEIGTTEH